MSNAAAIVGAVAVEVSKTRPDVFVGSALSETPGGAPTLYIKGPVDKALNDLVAHGGITILISDNQPFSWDELEERKLRVVHSLEARGFRYIAAGADIKSRGRILASVAAEPGLPTTAAELMDVVPPELRADVTLTVTEQSAFQDTNSSFGGMMVTKSGANDATSGWTVGKVIGSEFVTGVTTAGHASGENGIVHPGYGTHTYVFQSEHRGQWGDVEWHTTNQAEQPWFTLMHRKSVQRFLSSLVPGSRLGRACASTVASRIRVTAA